ncbi:hypothetical protein KAFR_0C04280 [Kazachstania africana CBS 2517]|uniref:non-specific serine/threonine protein kinase n=1 Tax=Kazachstania africana (strain ATCC 22294 / BCRC 22015 / CBS 2517 / CECT 1963 / NBRC 1671 / NRRL Y-8276) TaxID=1071382 RepID=H2ASR9_KAZAF|nr:hypothetical protein KAFR_0C04280 [Kazachstania africana CBS 2517]CCF57419.1 hypothetical protein KAFR_0C04280 [Kazachstania africana CBS 2517]
MSTFCEEDLPKIKDVIIGETIGQGSFGIVKSARIKDSNQNNIFAIKFIHLPSANDKGITEREISREVSIHMKCSNHPNILKFIDCNVTNKFLWMVLEMADGGDLFDKIEPDYGVDSHIAQFYFQQLIRALDYLHNTCGIAHRDIKPENILLDKDGNLKLADFGLASSFKRKDGTMRLSHDQRGSPPYMAPEILTLNSPYHANITDIWSVGVLLFVLLAGQVPWELPVNEDSDYNAFIKNNGNINAGPWSKIKLDQLNLLRKILHSDPSKRATLTTLKSHRWFLKKNMYANSKGLCKDPDLLLKNLLSNLHVSLTNENYEIFTQNMNNDNAHNKVISTQPVTNDLAELMHGSNSISNDNDGPFISHTQVKNKSIMTQQENNWIQYINNDIANLQFINEDNMTYLQSQLISNTHKKKLLFNPVKLTKFYTIHSMNILLTILEQALELSGVKFKSELYENFLKLEDKLGPKNVFPLAINLKLSDCRGGTLSGLVSIINYEGELKIIQFERKSGDPLEWRRFFKKIALLCRDIILIPN